MQTATMKAYRGIGMEGFIAKWYTANSRKRLDDYKILARRVATELPPGSRILEIAPGAGYFAIELAKLGSFEITGVDISRTFIEIARRNAAEAGVAVDFQEGNAAALPFSAGSFDFLVCSAAFKNFTAPVRALEEMHRVLKTGGSGLIADLRRDASREAVREAVDGMGLGPVNRVLTRLAFRFMLLKRAYRRQDFESMLAETSFRAAEIKDDGIGLEVSLRK